MNLNTFSVSRLQKTLPVVIQAGLVPYISGSPGNSKSSLVAQYAENNNLELIDIRLAQYEALDIGGLPRLNKKTNNFGHIPLDLFPIDGVTKVPKGKKGWMLFFDELPLASASTSKAAYKIMLDRYVGAHKLHDKCYMAAAGNLVTDGADAVSLNTALSSRLVHMRLLAPSAKEWLKWAYMNSIDFRITSFIESYADSLNNFDPNSESDTFACPRTWHFLSNMVAQIPDLTTEVALISATIGDEAGVSFNAFCAYADKLTDLDEVVKNPKKAMLPTEVSALLMSCSMLAQLTDKSNLTPVGKYIKRMNITYQVMFYRSLVARTPAMNSEPKVISWLTKNSSKII